MTMIAPSLLAADFSAMGEQLRRVQQAEAVHIDIMDGNFVPNLSMGPQMVEALRPQSSQIFDVHLMLLHPLPYVPVFRKAGADWLTFHVECADDPERVLRAIEESGAKPGMALKPATPAEALYPYGERLHCVTVMTVEPGFGGQKLMEAPRGTYRRGRQACPTWWGDVPAGGTGGPPPGGRRPGADLLVAGTAVFRAERPAEAMARLRGE